LARALDTPAGALKQPAIDALREEARKAGLDPDTVAIAPTGDKNTYYGRLRRAFNNIRDRYIRTRPDFKFWSQQIDPANPKGLPSRIKALEAKPKPNEKRIEELRERMEQYRAEREELAQDWGFSEYFTHLFREGKSGGPFKRLWGFMVAKARPGVHREGQPKQWVPGFLTKRGAPTQLSSQFLKHRRGKEGWIESVHDAFGFYLPNMLRKIHFDRALEQVSPIVDGKLTRFGPKRLGKMRPGDKVELLEEWGRTKGDPWEVSKVHRDKAGTVTGVTLRHPRGTTSQTLDLKAIKARLRYRWGGLLQSNEWTAKQYEKYVGDVLGRGEWSRTALEDKVAQFTHYARQALYHTTIGMGNVRSIEHNLIGGIYQNINVLGPIWAGKGHGQALLALAPRLTQKGRALRKLLDRSGVL
jgi:hypothetical protein